MRIQAREDKTGQGVVLDVNRQRSIQVTKRQELHAIVVTKPSNQFYNKTCFVGF